jgi:2-polyprenyl-3-methyl-5-hydroxy-6-metoxy-1,4-benzoquinol methylase
VKPLQTRTAAEGYTYHQTVGPRIYIEDGIQRERILMAREMIKDVLPDTGRLIELGCGTADISGPFAQMVDKYEVYGFDCNEQSVAKAKERFPAGHWTKANIADMFVLPTDVLVLCEVLEHLADPKKLVEEWLPKASAVVISHPIDGDLEGDNSGGEHQWSYSLDDFVNWFPLGGHSLEHMVSFKMGCYQVAIGYGRRK